VVVAEVSCVVMHLPFLLLPANVCVYDVEYMCALMHTCLVIDTHPSFNTRTTSHTYMHTYTHTHTHAHTYINDVDLRTHHSKNVPVHTHTLHTRTDIHTYTCRSCHSKIS